MQLRILVAFALFSSLLMLQPSTPVARAASLQVQIDMFGTQQVPAVETVAWGFVRFFWADDRLSAEYTVDVKGLSGTLVTGADIHRGAPGVNGPVVRHLADGGFIVTSGRLTLTPAERDEMLSGNWYVSLTSTNYPDGELRGQVIMPPGFLPASAPPAGVAPTTISPPDNFNPNDTSTHPPAVGICLADCGVQQPAPAQLPQTQAPAGPSVIRPPSTGDAGLPR